MDHDFFYPHRPRRTPLQLATYASKGGFYCNFGRRIRFRGQIGGPGCPRGEKLQKTDCQKVANTGQKVSKKPPKNERPQFWAPGRGPSVDLTPESDSTPKITIETTLRWTLAKNWQILRPVLQYLGDRKRYCTSPLITLQNFDCIE